MTAWTVRLSARSSSQWRNRREARDLIERLQTHCRNATPHGALGHKPLAAETNFGIGQRSATQQQSHWITCWRPTDGERCSYPCL